MFNSCSSLSSVNVSSFNTQNVTDMRWMFCGCSSLTSLDLSSFKTEKVTSMLEMFNGCSSLTTLDLSSFNADKADTEWMFSGCKKLKNFNCPDKKINDAYNSSCICF